MLLDILIPSNGQLSKLQPLMESLAIQTLQPDRVVILIHTYMTKEQQEMLSYFLQRVSGPELGEKIVLLTNLTIEYEPGHGVGYDRNILLQYAKAKFLYMIDHDNVFDTTMFAATAEWWTTLYEELGVHPIVSPTIMRRKSPKVQSQGITNFRYRMPKYTYGKMGAEPWQTVMMLGANSLFGLRQTFWEFGFDERFAKCYEDVDMTYRMYQAGVPLIVLNKVEIQHMESSKNPLQKMFLGNAASAYERSRNRIWFVKKNATFWQKIQYFGLGLWWQTLWFFLHVLFHGGKQRRVLWQAIIQGTKAGLGSS